MRQQGNNEFVDILNALRIGELNADHFDIHSFVSRVSYNAYGEFALDRGFCIYPTNAMVTDQINTETTVLESIKFSFKTS